MATTDRTNPRFARMYMRVAAKAEERGSSDHRRRLLDGLSGTVLELGAGHGLNFPHYPSSVTDVIAVEPETTLRAEASAAAARAPVPVRVVAGDADHLPVEDAGVDAAVASLVLCSVPDQADALAELTRVLRPGGELRFYEHVVPTTQPKRAMAKFVDSTGLWPKFAGGCHAARDTAASIEAAGFAIESLDRFDFSPGRFEPSMPHILGIARRA
jgi:ubiquinone/menaquinone biosynthesis C-methylase UbiE